MCPVERARKAVKEPAPTAGSGGTTCKQRKSEQNNHGQHLQQQQHDQINISTTARQQRRQTQQQTTNSNHTQAPHLRFQGEQPSVGVAQPSTDKLIGGCRPLFPPPPPRSGAAPAEADADADIDVKLRRRHRVGAKASSPFGQRLEEPTNQSINQSNQESKSPWRVQRPCKRETWGLLRGGKILGPRHVGTTRRRWLVSDNIDNNKENRVPSSLRGT